MSSRLALALAALVLASCASSPVRPSESTLAPPDRVLAFQNAQPSAGTLVVIRDSGFGGSGCFYAVSINGALAARLEVGERARFYVPPGEIVLRAGRDPQGRGLRALGGDNWTQRETSLKSGEVKYFRLSLDVNGKTDISRGEP